MQNLISFKMKYRNEILWILFPIDFSLSKMDKTITDDLEFVSETLNEMIRPNFCDEVSRWSGKKNGDPKKIHDISKNRQNKWWKLLVLVAPSVTAVSVRYTTRTCFITPMKSPLYFSRFCKVTKYDFILNLKLANLIEFRIFLWINHSFS